MKSRQECSVPKRSKQAAETATSTHAQPTASAQVIPPASLGLLSKPAAQPGLTPHQALGRETKGVYAQRGVTQPATQQWPLWDVWSQCASFLFTEESFQ